jgi:hypothetical protein
VVADPAVEERRWSTPELLAVEQRLVARATGRSGEQAARVSHEAVREALAAHPTAGVDQQAMVRDLCQGGQGVALVARSSGCSSGLPVPVSAGALEQPALIRATMARAASGRSLLLMLSPACGECVDTGSMPSVLVTAASWDRA